MKSRRLRFTRGQLAVVAAALLVVRSAKADDNPGAPMVVNPETKVTPVHLNMPTGSVNFDYLYQRDTDQQPGAPKTTSTENSFQETVSANMEGDLFSPNLLDFSAGGTFGLEQDIYGGTDGAQSSNSILDGWDVSGTALGASSTPTTIYTRRTQSFINPTFSPTLRDENTAYGATVNIQNSFAPTQISLNHTDDIQTEDSGLSEYELHQDSATWHSNFITLPNQTLTLDYNYQNTNTQEPQSSEEQYQLNEATLNHTLHFGPNLADSLTSSFSATDESGFLAYQEERLDENLRLQNTPTLQTHLEYTLDDTSINEAQEISNRLDGGFVHHLYQSLITSGDVGGQMFDYDGTDIDAVFGHLGVTYRKRVPDGLLLANLSLGGQYQQQSASDAEIPVLNQPLTFTNDNPAILNQDDIYASNTPILVNQQDIDIHSIKLFSNGVVYQKNIDYTVHRLGNLVEIQPLPGGRIPFGGSALTDYDLLPDSSNTTSTQDVSTGLRYEVDQGFLSGLAPYCRYAVQEQSISADQGGLVVPDTYHDLTLGSDYKIWKLTFNAEREQYQSSLVPYDADRFSVRFVEQAGLDTTFSLIGSFQSLDYYQENDQAQDSTVSATLTRRLNTRASISASVIYLNDRDQLFGNTEGLEEDVEFRWQYRQCELFVQGRNSYLDSNYDRGTFQTLEIGLKRSF